MPRTLINTIFGRPSRSYLPAEDDPRTRVNPYAPVPLPPPVRRRGWSPDPEYESQYEYEYAPGPSRRVSYSHTSPPLETDTSSALGYARSDLGLGLPPGTSAFAPGRSGRRRSPGVPVHNPFDEQPPPPPKQVYTTVPRHPYEQEYRDDGHHYSASPSPPPSVGQPRRPPLQPARGAFKPQPPTPGPTPPTSALGEMKQRSAYNRTAVEPKRELESELELERSPRDTASDDVSDSDNDAFYTPRTSMVGQSSDSESDYSPAPMSVPTLKLQPPTPLHDRTSPLDEPLEPASPSRGAPRRQSTRRAKAKPAKRDASTATSAPLDVTPPSPPPISSPNIPPSLPPKQGAARMSLPPRPHGIRNAQVTVLNSPGSSRPASPAPPPPPSSSLRRSQSASAKSQRPIDPDRATQPPPLPRPSSSAGFRSQSEIGTPSTRHSMHLRPGSALSEVHSQRDGVRTAGYGKGGWAAASAAPVVMYMPSSGNDGWAAFQPLPPRSRYTVLPGGTKVLIVDPDYERKASHGSVSTVSSSLAPSASASQSGRYRHSISPSRSPPSRSPVLGAAAFPRRHESRDPSLLSHSSSLASQTPLVAPVAPFNLSPVPSSSSKQSTPLTPSSPADSSDDEWDGEKPSRSYIRKPVPPPRPPVNLYDYSSDRDVSQPPAARSQRSTYSTPPESLRLPQIPHIPLDIPLDPTLHALRAPTPPGHSVTPARSPSPPPISSNLDGPSTINPDILTFLPEMSAEDSNRLYTERDGHRRNRSDTVRPSKSLRGLARAAMSEVGSGTKRLPSPPEDDGQTLASVRTGATRISLNDPARMGTIGPGDIVSDKDREFPKANGYTSLVLPHADTYALSPKPLKQRFDPRLASLPRTSMAAITLTSSVVRDKHESPTPEHLQTNLVPPVDFTSHMTPPSKVSDSQVMVQVYAAAVDAFDVRAVDGKGAAEVGKWVPGRSFVGRCVMTGSSEKDIQRGEIVMGLLDIKKSGALCEYLVIDRRRVARIPTAELSLEQLALLPLQGITTVRALRGLLASGASALVMDAHEGVPALMCQEMSRHGMIVTAVIPGGDDSLARQRLCMANGARGVLIGSPAAVMLALDESLFHLIVDTRGGTKIAEAAKRALVDGGRVLTLARPDAPRRGLNLSLRRARAAATVAIAGTGEAEVDTSGLDPRDVMEERGFGLLRPVVTRVLPFERGPAAFGPPGTTVVRIIN